MQQPEQLKPEEVRKEMEKPPEVVEKPEERIETPEALSELGEQTAAKVEETSAEAIEAGIHQIDSAVTSAGGGPEDTEAGKAAITEVQEEMAVISSEAQDKIREVSKTERAPVGLKDEYTPEQLAELRAKTKEDYGEGLVGDKNENLFQDLSKKEAELSDEEKSVFELTKWQRVQELKEEKGKAEKKGKEFSPDKAKWLEENEENYRKSVSAEDQELLDQKSQEHAYKLLEKKIEAGVVKPDAIQSDIMDHLELREKPEVTVESVEEISDLISKELQEFRDNPEIAVNEQEVELIKRESEKFVKMYQEAFPEAVPEQVYELVRDNAQKLTYQTSLDKRVFSGSDHGTRHILEGNMKWADKMIDSLGDRVTAKDKVLIHQVIIDHDLGYTPGVVHAKESFGAMSDHPLFSTKSIEANQDYYTQKFGKDGYEAIQNGVLMHSYPKSEYPPKDQMKDINLDTIRSITSTVDALGVTAETKCPAFFRGSESIGVLQKAKLFAETHDGKITQEAMANFKSQLREVAKKEPNETTREGFYNAIENQFSFFTIETTLGQHTGVMKDIEMTEQEGKLIPHVKMDISRSQALLGDIFGDKMSTKAFVKAMKDFGVPKEAWDKMGKVIKQIREAETDEEKKELMAGLKYESDKASFEFAPEFAEITPEIEKTFEEFERVTIRNEIRDLARGLESPEARTPENVESLLAEFSTAIGEQADKEDLAKIMEIQERIRINIDKPEDFDKALKEFNTFVTKREKEFMGIE